LPGIDRWLLLATIIALVRASYRVNKNVTFLLQVLEVLPFNSILVTVEKMRTMKEILSSYKFYFYNHMMCVCVCVFSNKDRKL